MESVQEKKKKLHILAVPAPAQSHISAMMYLCKRIAEDDCTISFVNVDCIHEQMQRHWVSPPGLDIRLESIPLEWNMPNGFDAYAVCHRGQCFLAQQKCYTVELRKLAHRLSRETGPICCILSDYFVPWSQDVATELGVPRVALLSGSAGWSTIEFHLVQLQAQGHIFRQDDSKEEHWIHGIGGLTPIQRRDLPVYLKLADDAVWVEQCLKRCLPQYRPSWLLVNTFYELERSAIEFMTSQFKDDSDGDSRYLPVGPLYLLSSKEPANVQLRDELEDNRCMKWLDKQEPGSVIYISFGSIACLTGEQFEELARALEDCKRPFLWVMRSGLVMGGICQGSYEEFVERTRERGFIVSWAPQLGVLAHPSVGAFLTHCGWNSVLESICNGVPILGWPWAGEQNTNCKFLVEDWGIGVRLATAKDAVVPRHDICKWINIVMDGEKGRELKDKVGKLRDVCLNQGIHQASSNLARLLSFLRERSELTN